MENSTKIVGKSEETVHDSLKGSYWLTRIVFLRSICAIYAVAFAIGCNQIIGLLGSDGLTPASIFMDDVRNSVKGSLLDKFIAFPSIFWFIELTDTILMGMCTIGLATSLYIVILGAANMPMMSSLWLLYLTLTNIGQHWYSFGWESQLLELGFSSIFLVPLYSLSQFPRYTPPSFVCILANRWLLFRIMIGAGLIKIRGDSCWTDLTCMNYHYETQPVPNPLSWYLHKSPDWVHQTETLANHIVELLCPWFIFMFREVRVVGGVIQVLFQMVLILSGNLSFLNWLTAVCAIFCFDDAFLSPLFPSKSVKKAQVATLMHSTQPSTVSTYCRHFLSFSLLVIIIRGSVPVVFNLLSPHQTMNSSFDSFRLVNTYGAFGTVTKERNEVILEIGFEHEDSLIPSWPSSSVVWKEIEFECKPGNINRRPCVISPYHIRLDWLMWFSAFQKYNSNPWTIQLGIKLLDHAQYLADGSTIDNKNHDAVAKLVSFLPRGEGKDGYPTWVRASKYSYKYSSMQLEQDMTASGYEVGLWWTRKKVGEYFPPIKQDFEAVKVFLRENHLIR